MTPSPPRSTLASMISMVLAGYLAGTTFRGFHAQFLGIHLGPVDTIFPLSGCLTIVAGLFAMGALSHRQHDRAGSEPPIRSSPSQTAMS